ncbi:natural resistance-associated macrophage protein-domain-containing protein [Flammula alnicola]|nr:natural resistance-associated macrophage protein-domain-containing protein [Flammula alnicola]
MPPPLQKKDDPPQTYASRASRGVKHGFHTFVHHVKRHVGVGIICSVAYFDPGNWSVDLQAGSSFGYRPMLFVILMAGLGAIVLQVMRVVHLASHCRLLLHDHPGTLNSFGALPLWAGVVLTAADVLIFLSFSDPSRAQGRPIRMFEYTIIGLVFAVFGCFIALLVKASPNWSQVFMGYVPDKHLFQSDPDAVYAAVGILGATVMPHALFLGSSLATQDRVSDPLLEEKMPSPASTRMSVKTRLRQFISPFFRITRAERVASTTDYRTKYGDRENNSLSFIRAHLSHGIADVVMSLTVLAVPLTRRQILILAGAVFFSGSGGNRGSPAGLFEAHDLIKSRLGDGAALIFALALVCAGQTSSITVTLAGQLVSEGFIEWKVSPFLRRLITRCISLIPSVIVAIAVGRQGINTLLVASQVVLSIVLPFVAFPLIYLTSREDVMRVRKPPPEVRETDKTPPQVLELKMEMEQVPGNLEILEFEETTEKEETLDFSNGRWLASLSYVIWCVVLVANAYAIVMLVLGQSTI